nr:hypothetical protein [Candidatus Omnitrophota bacterium]
MTSKQLVSQAKTLKSPSNDELMAQEAKYCSWGDTVHYAEKPVVFKAAQGSFLYDHEGTEYL